MAQKKVVLTTYIDDLTGDELTEDQVHTVSFGWSGTQYEIDLSKAGADKLEKFIKPYVEAGRRVGATRGRPRGSSSSSSRANTGSGRGKEELQTIREWAVKNGYEVSPRGRIKAEILEAFDAAHASKPAFSSA